MFHRYRPEGRFFCWIALGILLLAMTSRSMAVTAAKITRVTDIVYRADGTPAKGTLLISWPPFTAATGEAVAAGRATVAIGAAGQIDLPLVANTGSAPASYYTVVLQLDDGATATEYWTVPAAVSTTIAAIRSKLVPAGVAVQIVGRDYVDSALAAKASDAAVVHYAGTETISGAKIFTSNPVVPTPTDGTHAANKNYVDAAVQQSPGTGLSADPTGSQVITQPAGTSFQVNRADLANLNGVRQADRFSSIQSAIDDAGTSGAVVIPPGYTGQDSFTNPNGRTIIDLRRIGDARAGDISVKDFGASGDGGWYGYAHCTSGSAVISNVATTIGRLPKVGDTLVVAGCGVAGADLQCTLSAASGTQYGTATCGNGVTAGATLTNQGARWGISVDDTAAFSAAFTYCATAAATGGCKIKVPGGVYFVSNAAFPAKSGILGGQITLEGVGRTTSWIIGTGADKTAIFTAPASSVPTAVKWLGFRSYDFNNKKQIAVSWLGGSYHDFSDNDAYSVYEMLRASNTWENVIQRNRCYGAVNCIHFGPSGLGPVNATTVADNYIDSGFTGVAILSDATGSGGSLQNTYRNNTIQNDNPPFVGLVDINDNASTFEAGYEEYSQQAGVYNHIFRGGSNNIVLSYYHCDQIVGDTNNVTAAYPPWGTCPSQTYNIKNDGRYNSFYGLYGGIDNLSALSSGAVYGRFELNLAGLSTRRSQPGTAYDWSFSRADVAGTPFGRSNSSGANPSSPTAFGTSAVIPFGTIIANNSFNYGSPAAANDNVFWVCANSYGVPCDANPTVPSQWRRLGEASTRIRQESTSAPGSGTWTVGDFIWNTNPSAGILGWVCTVAGTPGTWTAVYAAPPLMNASGAVQLGAHQVTGSATLTSGSPSTATVTLSNAAVFTSSSSLSNQTTQANPLKITYSSGSSFVITGPNTASDVIGYVCTGN